MCAGACVLVRVLQRALHGRTPAYFAAAFGTVDALRALISGGADVNAADELGITLVMIAATRCVVVVVGVVMVVVVMWGCVPGAPPLPHRCAPLRAVGVAVAAQTRARGAALFARELAALRRGVVCWRCGAVRYGTVRCGVVLWCWRWRCAQGGRCAADAAAGLAQHQPGRDSQERQNRGGACQCPGVPMVCRRHRHRGGCRGRGSGGGGGAGRAWGRVLCACAQCSCSTCVRLCLCGVW